ncbi:MAG: DsbC family protein [Pseudomarimonas sp.]
MTRTLAAAVLAAFTFSTQAAGLDDAQVRAAIASLVPNATIESIAEAKLPGFYEVVLPGQILYVTTDGKFLLHGNLYDVVANTNLTEGSRSEIRRAVLKAVDPEQKISFSSPEAKYVVTVFTDIDCGYCKKMHSEMAIYNSLGIGIEYMFFPRAGAGSESWEKAVSVWCSDDRRQAMTDAKADKPLDRKECVNPIEDDYAVGNRIGVSGTPMVIAADGTQLGGYLPPEQMLARLEQLANPPVK